MTSPKLPITTERLLLRRFERSDLDAVMAYCRLPDVQRYVDWKARDPGEARSAIAAMSGQHRLNRPGDAFTLAMTRREDGAVMGHISLRWTDATAAQCELRFVLDAAYRGNGYAGEAVRAALHIGFGHFAFHRIFVPTTRARRGCSRPSACGSRPIIASTRCSRATGTRNCISPSLPANGCAVPRLRKSRGKGLPDRGLP